MGMPLRESESLIADPTAIQRDPLNQRLLKESQSFAARLERMGYEVAPYSTSSLQRLSKISSTRKWEIIRSFQTWSQWIGPGIHSEDGERRYLKRALDHYGLRADEEFWKTIDQGQIIEFYGPDMIQLYRSFNFFGITGYSLLDISVFEWYVLWQRPSRAIEETVNDLQDVLREHIPVKRFQIPKQLIRETYQPGSPLPDSGRAIVAEFLNAGSLRTDSGNAKPNGFICTSRAEVIASGKEALNIQFV